MLGDRLRVMADFLDRVVFPPRGAIRKNFGRIEVAIAANHQASVAARGHCRIKRAGRHCWMCAFKLTLRRPQKPQARLIGERGRVA